MLGERGVFVFDGQEAGFGMGKRFEEAHEAFLKGHLAKRTGERRDRLLRGHNHGEKLFLKNVWWPERGNFDGLHPEYEIVDWRGRSYFADFAWLWLFVKLVIEIKGYRTHVQEMDRTKHSLELNRETFLCAMGYSVISFAYDDVEQRPELCRMLLRMVLARFLPQGGSAPRALLAEKEAIRLTISLGGSARPVDIERHFEVDKKTAIRMLRGLCDKGWLVPAVRDGGDRVVRYELARSVADYRSEERRVGKECRL